MSPSIWPLVGAFGAGLMTIGLVYDRRWFLGGLVVLVATTIEWTVQAWSDRASDDPEYNARVRGRLMHPLEFPILGALSVVLVIFGFSRVMLAIPKSAAVGVFIGLGAARARHRRHPVHAPEGERGGVRHACSLLGGVGILTAGVVGASTGERDELHNHVEETGTDKQTSNAVADKSSVAATVSVTPGNMTPDGAHPAPVGLAQPAVRERRHACPASSSWTPAPSPSSAPTASRSRTPTATASPSPSPSTPTTSAAARRRC